MKSCANACGGAAVVAVFITLAPAAQAQWNSTPPGPTAKAAVAAPPPTTNTPPAPPPAAAPPAAPPPGSPPPAPYTVVTTTKVLGPPLPPPCPPPRELEPLFAPSAFLVRFTAGPGYVWASGDPNTKLTGAAGSFDLTMGGFVARNLALHADFGWIDAFDPDFTVDGNVVDSTSVTFQASTFRAGASYYFMPVRAYASLGVGFAVAALTSYTYADSASVTLVGREYTKIGPSMAAELGKEFAVSPFWALGIAAHYELLSVPPGDDHSKATVDFAQNLSLRFVATFGDR